MVNLIGNPMISGRFKFQRLAQLRQRQNEPGPLPGRHSQRK
jgi:hypothetical protein